MKKIFFLAITGVLFSCGSTSTATNDKNSNAELTKNNQQQVSTEKKNSSKSDFLVGKQDRKALEQEPYGNWFNANYKNYTVDTRTVEKISPYLKNITIKAFMGTWCSDSKRETPTIYKILDASNFSYKNLELITVTRSKDTPEGFEKDLDIMRVPTFIFYKNGEEIGRYVEFARETLEKDILAIVSEHPYKHSYED
ncbi:thioredoxin family protein [Aquimarina spinulae]|uniref:thioredoxin family protein n=1 Tax=Aquimarina spinulae TaxID=1192023 RepID=UPI000D554F6C|nr:thioredoxin family protein [Aquimarina spinulae]